jgi:hypothetical protein
VTGYLMASALTDIFYVARRLVDFEAAHAAVQTCLDAFEFCPVDRQTLELAHAMSGKDFEDNLQMMCADVAGLDAIITRNPDDFQISPVQVLTPKQILEKIG